MKQNKVINLSDYREEKKEESLKDFYPIEFPAFEVDGYYTYPVLGIKMHCILITENSHIHNNEPVCIMEDQFGNIFAAEVEEDSTAGWFIIKKEDFLNSITNDSPPPRVG